MVVLGLILLVLAAALTLGIVFSNTDPAMASAFGVSLDGVSIGGLFLAGVITGAVALLGLSLMFGGAARKRRKKVAAKREASHVRTEAETLAEENARLQAELQQSQQPSTTTYPTGGTADDASSGKHGKHGLLGRR